MGKYKDYDSEPVTYCARCYSLGIIHDDVIDSDCCRECGCTDFKTTSIEKWEELYVKMYGHKYAEASHDIRKSPIFQMSLEKLKTKVFNDSSWKNICKKLYPSFPEGLSKADSIVLLFTKLIQENRIDDLRMKLMDNTKEKE